MHKLSSTSTALLVLLVCQLLLAFAPNPVHLAPTGEEYSVSRLTPNEPDSRTDRLSSASSEGESDLGAQNVDTQTTSNTEASDVVGGYDDSSAAREEPSAEQRRSDAVECAICLGSINEGSLGQPEAVACGHTFHADCIEMWRQQRGSQLDIDRRVPCPMCRADISTGQNYQSHADSDDDLYEPSYGWEHRNWRDLNPELARELDQRANVTTRRPIASSGTLPPSLPMGSNTYNRGRVC